MGQTMYNFNKIDLKRLTSNSTGTDVTFRIA